MGIKNIDLSQELSTKHISVDGQSFYVTGSQFFAKSKSGKQLHLCQILLDYINSTPICQKLKQFFVHYVMPN